VKLTAPALAIAIVGLTVTAQAQQITGAGATFPAPVYTKWGEAAKTAIGIELNYQAIGSGGGQNQIFNRTVDFGASDAPVDASKLQQHNLLQFPTVMGAVVMVVNIPGLHINQLKLTGKIVADIYRSKISNWDDPRLAAANPGMRLPNLEIAPVHRADASGTSYVFTSYLSAVSSDWKSEVGADTSVNWPVGVGARGNYGVAATVRNTRGGIGYVEYAYAAENNLTTAQLRNKAGKFVIPTMATFEAAASNADWAKAQNYAIDLIDQPGAQSWPIMSTTFILLPKDPTDKIRSADVMRFFDWAYAHGAQIAEQLDYIPLPRAVQDSVRHAWRVEVKNAVQFGQK
jgi:phosphate transport system substrate-binding protein